MKKFIIYILGAPILLLVCCKAEVDTFSDTSNRINFSTSNIITSYSFAYGPKSKTVDTVWVDLSTIGFISNAPRKVQLIQIPFDDGRPEAEAGKHYLDFNDPKIAGRYVIPAGKNNVSVPVVILRDPSLQTQEVSLKIGMSPNENFQHGYTDSESKTITIVDFLSMPTDWNSQIIPYYGPYGKIKHQFMMDAVAPLGYIVDNSFMKELRGGEVFDAGLRGYWVGFMRAKLTELNASRAGQGIGPLRESPLPGQTEGTLVSFP